MTALERVVLHVGAHKTGTTHFQKGLRKGRADLEAAGCALYLPSDLRPAPRLARMLGVSFQSGRRRDDWSPALPEAMARGKPTLVISEENVLGPLSGAAEGPMERVYPEAAPRLRTLLCGLGGVPATVLLSVRDPGRFVLSAYSQALLAGRGGAWQAFVARMPVERVDWADLAARIVALEGVAELVVWRLEDYPEIANAAVARIAGRPLPSPPWFAHDAAHQGLSAAAVAAALAAPEGARRKAAASEARQALPRSERNPPFRPLSPGAEAASAAAYADQIARLDRMARVVRLGKAG
ncbi:hypothetical protein OG2516_08581 [Oceanicola granulosus HTCC2516]|uniref:Sulfotransferase domain-containing protein n=1 Tax=Oceanicola granulosus (strain ATCC BAA-861 / DSM 15982 / KCTC 12143 / HTCC2516) TaxID=314256 RepID=Q2C9V6_OCEGH|nr:hypothetical protein [Oceanicola granulosus]EAR49460.1 hypothetical protein OG2516_08581 [Oceanicola granulosus HTCC2516]